MRRNRSIHRAEDMELVGSIKRTAKGQYLITIKFKVSKRLYHAETISAENKEHAKRFYRLEHPTLVFPAKPRLERLKSTKPAKEKKHAKLKPRRAKADPRSRAKPRRVTPKSKRSIDALNASAGAPKRRRTRIRATPSDQAVD